MAEAPLENYYRTALEELGLILGDDDALEDDPASAVPGALRACYRVAGRSLLNSAHNRVLGPHELRTAGGKVIFAEENQEVVVWGFDASTVVDDPEVWQGQPVGGTHDQFQWFSEEAPLSRFMIEMIRHTVGHEPPAPEVPP